MASPAFAAQVLLINFSSAAGNDITSPEATTLGAEAFVNVRTNATFGLDGVTGSVASGDYFQQHQKAELGQPYATLLGGKKIGGSDFQATISLNLASWMATESYTGYEITIFYAGRSLFAEGLMTDSVSRKVHLSDGTNIADDYVTTVVKRGGVDRPEFWGGTGDVLTGFEGSNLTINMDLISVPENTNFNETAGIAAVMIKGVPEPSSAALLGLGGIALILRRRKN